MLRVDEGPSGKYGLRCGHVMGFVKVGLARSGGIIVKDAETERENAAARQGMQITGGNAKPPSRGLFDRASGGPCKAGH